VGATDASCNEAAFHGIPLISLERDTLVRGAAAQLRGQLRTQLLLLLLLLPLGAGLREAAPATEQQAHAARLPAGGRRPGAGGPDARRRQRIHQGHRVDAGAAAAAQDAAAGAARGQHGGAGARRRREREARSRRPAAAAPAPAPAAAQRRHWRCPGDPLHVVHPGLPLQVVPRLGGSLPVVIDTQPDWELPAEALDDIFLGDAELW
jgi:hypothetical protein